VYCTNVLLLLIEIMLCSDLFTRFFLLKIFSYHASGSGCGVSDDQRGGRRPRYRQSRSNRVWQILALYWRSPESGGVWHKSSFLKETICPGSGGGCGVSDDQRGAAVSSVTNKSRFADPCFVLALAGIRRRVVQIKFPERNDSHRFRWRLWRQW